MNENWIYFLRAMLMTVLATVYLYLLTESRYEKKRTDRTVYIGVSVVITINFILYLMMGGRQYIKYTPLLLNFPLFLLFVMLSRHRDFRIVFTLLTVIFASYTITLAGIVCSLPFAENLVADTIGRMLSSCLFLILFLRIRNLYFYMHKILKHGWSLFCIVPLAFYASAYLLIMRVSPAQRSENLFLQIILAMIVIVVYAVIFFFFRQTEQYSQHENERQLLKVQIAAFQQQAAVLLEGERQLTILRHDMRHYIHTISSLLQTGNVEHALQVTNEYDESLLKSQGEHWCDNKVINAVLSYYLGQAQQKDIQVDAVLDLPDTPACTELSIVIANMVENALQACCKQPSGEKRCIVLRAVSTPQLVIEIANTYNGEVNFGWEGLPIPTKQGHGIGTKSIQDFARRHGATCTFSVTDGMFRVRLLILLKTIHFVKAFEVES